MNHATWGLKGATTLALSALVFLLACGGTSSSTMVTTVPPAAPVTAQNATSFSFGVMADTQWTGVAYDGKNPNSVAVDIINQLGTQFINNGVKFVVQVGDLTDNGSNVALDTTAAYRQALYNAGIGFFPLRGNHEYSTAAATEFVRVFPQTSGGSQNATPADVWALASLTDTAVEPANTRARSRYSALRISLITFCNS